MSNAVKLFKEHEHLIPKGSPVPNRRILVVDDEPEIAQGIQRILSPQQNQVIPLRSSRGSAKPEEKQKSEFEVVVVNTPQRALEEIKKSIESNNPFAVGFFDVMLGAEMDGIELVQKAFQIDPRLFAVFVTAYHDRSVDSIGNFLGEESREKWDYINKPFTEGEILQKARNSTSLWDLNRLKDWQADRLSEAHQILLSVEKQNAVAAIGRSVAHEFGNLLTHIIGHAEIAQMSDQISEIKNSLDIILKAGNTAASVLKNFRNLNEAHDKEADFKIHNIMHIIDEAIELMEFRFRRHNIKVKKTGLASYSAEVNKSSIIQVFANLFINAIHAMPQGGELLIDMKEEDSSVSLSVKDSGTGIDEKILSRVTEPLFTTKGSEGSGLGLAICKEIIEVEHGGSFKISNHPKGGVVVQFMIPQMKEKNNGFI